MNVDTDGIVLRQIKAASGRRMISLFTQKYGKISCGTSITERNSKSKSALAISPFAYGHYEIYKNRDHYDINGADVKKSFYGIGDNLDRFFACSYVLELTDKALPEEAPQPGLYSLLLDFLMVAEKRKTAFDTLIIAYQVKLLDILGCGIATENCASCGEKSVKAFSIPEGGMICENCLKKIYEKTPEDSICRLIYEPGFDIVSIVEYFRRKPLAAFEKIALEESTARELRGILKEYIAYHLDISALKSESLL